LCLFYQFHIENLQEETYHSYPNLRYISFILMSENLWPLSLTPRPYSIWGKNLKQVKDIQGETQWGPTPWFIQCN